MKNLKVEPWISSSSYFFEQENSRCYLTNEKKRTELMLEGIWADLWYVLITTQDYDKVKRYAHSRSIEENLNEFLEELRIVGLLSNSEQKENFLYSSCSDENEVNVTDDYSSLISEKVSWLVKHNFLFQLTIELSYKCNLACKHCYNDKSDFERKLNFQSAKQIIDSAIKLGVNNVYLSSGECTLHPDFVKIIKYIREKRISFSFATNGVSLYEDDELFEQVLSLYPHSIRISLYSMQSDIHDAITGVKGSHKKVVSVIRKLRERNVPVHINYFQLRINKDSLSDVLKFKNEVGAELSADIFFLDNKNNNNSYVQATDEQLYELFQDKYSPYYDLLKHKNPCFGNDEGTACKNIKGLISVSPQLDVFPCISLKYKIGSLKEKTLEEIWDNEYSKFLDIYKVKNLKDCKSCKYFEYCIFCPCMGTYENGFLEKSDICCRFTKIRMKILQEQGELPINIDEIINRF